MPAEIERNGSLIQTDLRHGERRLGDRRATDRHGWERRKRERRGRMARAGLFVTAMTFGSAMSGPVLSARPSEIPAGLAAGTQALLSPIVPEFAVQMNDAVRAAINQYQGQAYFAEALSRGAPYLPRIQDIFRATGIPTDLAYVALVESEFKPQALSWANAKGVWQFIPETGRRFGLELNTWIDERSNPEKATLAAAQYLKYLYGMFRDWNLALAAYNAGEGTVLRGIKRYGTSDFWQLARTKALARETKNYVPRIQAAILMAREPEKYGLTIAPAPPQPTEVVEVNKAVDLKIVARCIQTDVDAITALNPELRRRSTPANQEFELRVPEGTADIVGACLATIPEGRRVRIHVVRRGQTLAKLARLYSTPIMAIAEANSIRPRQRLMPGTELIIPLGD